QDQRRSSLPGGDGVEGKLRGDGDLRGNRHGAILDLQSPPVHGETDFSQEKSTLRAASELCKAGKVRYWRPANRGKPREVIVVLSEVDRIHRARRALDTGAVSDGTRSPAHQRRQCESARGIASMVERNRVAVQICDRP